MVVVSSLTTGVMTESSAQYLTVSILSGLLAIYLVSKISRRTDLTRAGVITGLGLAYLCFSVSLAAGIGIKDVLLNSGWGLASGFFSAILTIGALAFLEPAFDITTDFRLIELSDPTQPILRELMMKAPGTYNHSIVTANLAEAAAEAVGANPLLVRVGSYYHDVGKIKRPFFFVENQLCNENPHDHTNPNLSYLIITAHVKEGVEIAKKYKLPSEIIDIIGQHHGTSVVTYFFHRAKERIGKEEVSESRFRYTGEKPRTKDAALVMLADSVEAAARTVHKPSPNRLEQLIKKILKTKLEDGQLDESLLTLRDLEKITKSFVQSITTIYHSRIEYPEGEVVPFKRGIPAHGSSNK
jgi:putative nucleotidyltransferase with HDIG domain